MHLVRGIRSIPQAHSGPTRADAVLSRSPLRGCGWVGRAGALGGLLRPGRHDLRPFVDLPGRPARAPSGRASVGRPATGPIVAELPRTPGGGELDARACRPTPLGLRGSPSGPVPGPRRRLRMGLFELGGSGALGTVSEALPASASRCTGRRRAGPSGGTHPPSRDRHEQPGRRAGGQGGLPRSHEDNRLPDHLGGDRRGETRPRHLSRGPRGGPGSSARRRHGGRLLDERRPGRPRVGDPPGVVQSVPATPTDEAPGRGARLVPPVGSRRAGPPPRGLLPARSGPGDLAARII